MCRTAGRNSQNWERSGVYQRSKDWRPRKPSTHPPNNHHKQQCTQWKRVAQHRSIKRRHGYNVCLLLHRLEHTTDKSHQRQPIRHRSNTIAQRRLQILCNYRQHHKATLQSVLSPRLTDVWQEWIFPQNGHRQCKRCQSSYIRHPAIVKRNNREAERPAIRREDWTRYNDARLCRQQPLPIQSRLWLECWLLRTCQDTTKRHDNHP